MNRKSTLWSLASLLGLVSILISACGTSATPVATGNEPAMAATNAPAEEPVEIHLAFLTFNRISEDLESVESAIDAITVPKINVKVKLHPYSIADYSQQINLSLQSGEGLDVFHTLGDLPQQVSQNKVTDITNMIDQYAPEAKAIAGDNFLKASTVNGKLYGIPAYKGVATAPNLVYRADIMEEIGVDPTTIKSVNDLSDVFAKVKEKHPDMIPLVPNMPGELGLNLTVYGIDTLSDSYFLPKAVLVGDSLNVVNYYETQEFKEIATLVRDWYNKGYILKDAATTTSAALELMSSGNAFSYIAGYAGEQAYVQISAQTGYDIRMARLGKPYLNTGSINALTWSVASTSKHPEAALQFMNLIFSDKDVINLIIYGIEGRDYLKVDDDHVQYPDGQDANTVPYTAQLSCGIVGNQFIQYAMAGTDMADLQLMLEENQNSAVSPALGFTFDNSIVSNEESAVLNVINEYLPGLNTGSVDPEVEIPNFVAKLKAAGLDKIIAAKQAQLDEWAVQQK
jgi:putative aldouronate transport system substrate-binding protein